LKDFELRNCDIENQLKADLKKTVESRREAEVCVFEHFYTNKCFSRVFLPAFYNLYEF